MLLSAYRAFVALITFCFVAFLFQGLLTGNADAYFTLVSSDILVMVTVADLYLSIALGCTMISILERKWWTGVLVFLPSIVIGGPVLGLYLLWRLPAMLRAVRSTSGGPLNAGTGDSDGQYTTGDNTAADHADTADSLDALQNDEIRDD